MEDRKDKQDAQRIILIKESLTNAEKSLQTAKSLLAQLESKYTPQKKTYGVAEGGKVVEGTFDGQVMIGMDGRQYPVPANYASKSKLVEGDMLKLVITEDGNFIYKQIGPFKRKRIIGLLSENAKEGGYIVESEGKIYKVLLAAVTYHHANPGDEIALVVADNDEAQWGAIENVIKKGSIGGDFEPTPVTDSPLRGEIDEEERLNPIVSPIDQDEEEVEEEDEDNKEEDEAETKDEEESDQTKAKSSLDIDEELAPDLEEIEKELRKQASSKK